MFLRAVFSGFFFEGEGILKHAAADHNAINAVLLRKSPALCCDQEYPR